MTKKDYETNKEFKSNSCNQTPPISNTAKIVGMTKTTLTYSVTVE